MKEFLNQKVIITTQGWFYGPDGVSYRAGALLCKV
jgi:hypothetical protein